jgi:hypothetical protein
MKLICNELGYENENMFYNDIFKKINFLLVETYLTFI